MMFSKYEVYTTVQSIYCYKGTDVLKNKLGIKDKKELKSAEEELVAIKQLYLYENPIDGRFSKSHLCAIHHFLFEDIYLFAGQLRREQISKGDTAFYPPQLINRELLRVFHEYHHRDMYYEHRREKQLDNLSYMMTELNIIHPFREGNGRAIRELVRCMALRYGMTLDWSRVGKKTMLNAAVASVDDNMAFRDVIEKCIIE